MSRRGTALRPGNKTGPGVGVVGTVKFVVAVALAVTALDTVLARVVRLRPEFSIYPVHIYFARSYVLYALFIAACALAGAGFGFILSKIRPRRFPGTAAAAAGGALFAPVLGLAIILNRAFTLTISHPAILAGDVVVLLLWIFLSVYVGARVFARFGPTAARGWGRAAWGVLGYGGLVLLIIVLGYIYALPAITRPPAPERPMNVLLISIDALRRDHLGCYGYERVGTPNIDRFAASATKFENAYCSSPWTLPSMASMITGRYPSICGVDAGHRIRQEIPTLAEILRSEGYRSEAYVTNVFMHPEFGYAKGFDVYLMNGDSRGLYPLRGTLFYEWAANGLRALEAKLGRGRDDTTFNGDETVAALKRLGKGERPFFIWCHFMDPHGPYTPPPGYVPDYPGTAATQAYDYMKELLAEGWGLDHMPMDEDSVEKFEMLYDGEIAYVDEEFGNIMAALEEDGLINETVVAVLNDHGEEFFDHGGFEHGHTLYPELINMVLIVRIPGQDLREAAATGYVSHVDIVPTVLDALGLTAAVDFDGQSFLGSAPTSERAVFAECVKRGTEKKAVRRAGWLLIRDWVTGDRQLYDLSADPTARENLVGKGLTEEESLALEIAAYAEMTGEAVKALGAAPEMNLPEDRKRRLKGLGYIGP
jgi:arylsulfatase A-like enzyme